MLPTLLSIFALLVAVAFLLLGHGLLLTLLPISASESGFSDSQVAFTGSAYFLGFVSGCLAAPYVLKRVGHIRSFAVLATSYSVVILIFPWLPDFWSWLILRFLAGIAISGLYMIIESWLNERSNSDNRGSILSVYTMITMIMIVCGQQLLNLGNVNSHMLFGLAAIFISIAIIPVSLTLTLAPAPMSHISFDIAKVWRSSHVALISAITAGLVTGAYWTLAPVYAKTNNFDKAQLTAFMSATVFGAACFQWPLGRLSDKHDRRLILMYMALAGSLASLAFVLLPLIEPDFGGWPATVVAFFWGGACMTLYAIGLAHANDNASSSDFVETGSAMLITYGLCSAIGAPMASIAMNIMGASGLYAFGGLSLFVFFIVIVFRRRQHVLPIAEEDRGNFQAITDLAGPTVYEIDPRNHSDDRDSEPGKPQ